MRTRSILVSFPSIPFTVESLLPSAHLASLAAALQDAGHETRVLDYGTIPVLDRLYPKPVRKAARILAERFFGESSAGSLATLSALVRLRNVERMRAERAEHIYHETAVELARELHSVEVPDFVIFHVGRAREFHGILEIAKRLRAWMTSVCVWESGRESSVPPRLLAAGPFIEDYGEVLTPFAEVFDCLCVRSPESTIVAWAESVRRPELWASIANLVVHGQPTQRAPGLSLNQLPRGCYDAAVYPAAINTTKLHLPSLQSSRVVSAWPDENTNGNEVEAKSPRLLADEMAACIRDQETCAFHLTEAAPSANHAAALAHAVLSQGIQCHYCTEGAISGMNSGILTLLKASGCRGMLFPVETGSQWLLEDFYRRDAGVSEIEYILKACRSAEIFTITRFTYPCPADDCHSLAETLRLITRTRPQAVLAQLPEIPPDSPWHRRPEGFGFEMDVAGYLRNAAAGKPVYPWHSQAYRGNHPRSLRQALTENQALLREIEQMGISTVVTPQLALIAHISGYSGHEKDYAAIVSRRLFTGDAAGIETIVKEFNACVKARAHAAGAAYQIPLMAAVGN